jgi:hypothetical protein
VAALISQLFGASGSMWLRAGVGVAGVASVVAAAIVLVATIRRPVTRGLGVARVACLLVSAGLIGLTFAGAIPRWGLACACLAFLLALQAMALEFAVEEYLRAQLERADDGGQPGWWPDFERRFRRYAQRRQSVTPVDDVDDEVPW